MEGTVSKSSWTH